MKRVFPFLTLILIAALLLPACGPAATPTPEPTDVPLVFTDGLGRTVTLAGPAQRIVSMAPSNTEILFAIGAGSQVVGRDEFTNYPPEAMELPSIGGSMSDYNLEQIVSLNPDLVLAAEINTPEQVKAIEDLGLTVFYLNNPTELDGLYTMLETVGKLSGQEAQVGAMVTDLRARAAAVANALAGIEERPSVFYELDGSDAAKPWTVGEGPFIDLLIRLAGGENVGAAMGAPYGQLSLEALLVADPAIILLGDSNYGVTVEQVAARTGWGDLSAVQGNRVYPFNDDLVSRPGPRMIDGLEEMARIFHPDRFK